MTDFKVGALFETNAPQVARDVNRVADSMDNVGKAAGQAGRGTDALTLSQQRLELANRKVVQTGETVEKMQRRGATSTTAYTRELERHLRAQQQVLTETARIERMQSRSMPGGRMGGLGGAVVGGVAGYFTGQAVARYLLDSRDAASSLNDTVGKSRTLFGGASAAVERFGKTANTQIGASKQQAIEAAAGFGTMFKAAGVGGRDLATLSVGFTKLGADLAAYNHETDATAANHALQQAMHGQYDTLAQYGIVLTTADVKQKAFQLGLIHTVKDALTPAATAQSVYALATERATVQTGAFARQSGEAAEKTQILAATSENAKSTIGQGLIPVMNDLTDIAQKDLLPALEGVGKVLGFLGEHDTTRRLGEIAIAMLALRIGVNALRSAYDRLAFSAGRAAVAEEAAAVAGPGAGGGVRGQLPRIKGLGVKTGVGTLIAADGSLIVAGLQRGKVDQLSEGARLRGHSGGFSGRSFIAQGEQAAHLFGGLLGTVAPGVSGAIDRATGYTADMAALAQRDQIQARIAAAAERAAMARHSPAFQAAQGRLSSSLTAQAGAAYNVRNARAYLDSRSYVQDAGSVPLGSLLGALPEKPDESIVENAREAQKSAQAGLAIAQARATEARRGKAGASTSAMLRAEAAVARDQAAIRKRGGDSQAESLRLQADEARLAEMRKGTGATALSLMTAEKGLTDARRTAHKANEALHKAEKEASGDKSLSLKEVLDRATHTASTSTAEAGNVKTLVAKGLTQPVIAELEELEQSAPGTIAKVAKGLTPAYVKQLNADAKARTQAALDIARLGGVANLNDLQRVAAAAGNKVAKATTDAYLAGLKDPEWQKQAATVIAGLLLPDGTPGTPATPGAGAQPGGLDDFGNQQAGVPPGVKHGVTSHPSAPAAHAAAKPVIVSPRTTHHHNNFPNVKTTAQHRAELDKLERLDAQR